MYLWRRLASQKWWSDSEKELRAIAGNELAIIERPGRKQLQLEVASSSRTELQSLATQFRGRLKPFQPIGKDDFRRSRKPNLSESVSD
jgi:hypothetical protein